MNLFEFSLKWKGFPIMEAKKLLKEIQSIPESEYEAFVRKQRMEIVAFHLAHNPFYKKFTASSIPASWDEVPLMQKSDMQQPLSLRLSEGFTKKNVYVNKTSGSSGHPFIFAKDRFCHALTWAEIIHLYKKWDIEIGKSLEARFYGIPLDFFGYKKEQIKDFLGRRCRFPIFDLSDEKLASYLQLFKQKKFVYINGYTSSLVLFAKYLDTKNIVLTTVCPSLNCCIVTSEMLFESDKTLLQKAFGVPIINEYGASELGVLGFTNRKREFNLNCESLFIEIVDDANNPVPDGTLGRIVVTSLFNKAHPMIRYDIGDLGLIEPGSSFKFRKIGRLIGRTNDVAELPNGKKVPGLTFYYVTKTIIEENGQVKEFIVEQNEIDLFTVIYAADSPLKKSDYEKIIKAMEKYVGSNLRIQFKHVDILERSNRGKLKQFIKRF